MDQPVSVQSQEQEGRLGDRAFYALAIGLAFLAYFAVFLFTSDEGVPAAAESSLRNLVPLVIVSASAQAAVSKHLIGRSKARQVGGHALFALLYTVLLYWLLMILIGVSRGGSFTEFAVRAFFRPPRLPGNSCRASLSMRSSPVSLI